MGRFASLYTQGPDFAGKRLPSQGRERVVSRREVLQFSSFSVFSASQGPPGATQGRPRALHASPISEGYRYRIKSGAPRSLSARTKGNRLVFRPLRVGHDGVVGIGCRRHGRWSCDRGLYPIPSPGAQDARGRVLSCEGTLGSLRGSGRGSARPGRRKGRSVGKAARQDMRKHTPD
jgi:hypothetical protein